MNMRTFNKLMKGTEIKRHPPEWKMFLEICDLYLKRKGIKNPTVVEVGLRPDEESQCNFFEQLFAAKCIIEVNPDKDTVDILSISGGYYEDVKKNFEAWSPLCKGIIVIHGIESCRYKRRKAAETWKFWDELKLKTARGEKEYEDFLFISIHRKLIRGNQKGIGVIIKQ